MTRRKVPSRVSWIFLASTSLTFSLPLPPVNSFGTGSVFFCGRVHKYGSGLTKIRRNGIYHPKNDKDNIDQGWLSCASIPQEERETDETLPASTASTKAEAKVKTEANESSNHKNEGPPAWMKCVNGIAPKTGPLNEIVSILANVPLERANELIDIGAVWARMDTLDQDDILGQYDSSGGNTARADLSFADLPKGWHGGVQVQYGIHNSNEKEEEEEEDLERYIERMESQRYRRILFPSTIEAGTDVRIYPRPRRFPSCYEMDETRLLYEDTTFLVVDKPPMLPTQPDASNYKECCPGCVNDLLGPFQTIEGDKVSRPLLCHRVDSVVGGCVVLSKDGNGQKVFSQLQRDRKLKKIYLTITNKPVPLGRHIHWMWAPQLKRGEMAGPPCQFVSHSVPLNRKKAKNWIRCVLEVVKSEPIQISKSPDHTYDPGDKQHYQSTIRLVTGRKHQVRAQLASLGCPIIRDTLYQPIAGFTLDGLNGGTGNGGDDDDDGRTMETAVDLCRVPTEPIGLQAHAILFGGVRAKARTPWWGDGS